MFVDGDGKLIMVGLSSQDSRSIIFGDLGESIGHTDLASPTEPPRGDLCSYKSKSRGAVGDTKSV